MRVALAGGMVAGAFAVAQPAESDAVISVVGACDGTKAIGSLKGGILGDGLTDTDNKSATVSLKGIAPVSASPSDLGECIFDPFAAGLAIPDSGKPVVTGYTGTKQILKWGTKLNSPEVDCDQTDSGDTTEWVLSGKFSITFTDLNNLAKNQKLDAYLVVDGFTDPDNDPMTPSDVVTAHGVVTKGVAVGADLQTESIFDPILKDAAQLTDTPVAKYNWDIGGAVGCTTATQGDANILYSVNGDAMVSLLGLTADGVTLTIGSA